MADQKLTQLTALASLSSDDLFYVVDDPAGAALSRKMAASVLDARYLQDAPSDGSTYGRNNAAWVVVGAGSLPVADTQTIVKGSADATKLFRFEIDGFTAGATRVMTPPNQDFLAAGQNVANVFTVDQTYTANLIYAEPAGASHKFYAVDPVDPDAKLFNWNIATSDNAGSLRDNVVMNWGYNVAAGGGPEDDTDGCFYQQLETFYQPGGTSQFEYHWDFFLSGGADPGIRPMHLNCVHNTGLIDLHWFTDGINWSSAHDGQFDLMVMTVGADEANSRINIYVPTIHEQLLSFAGTTHAGLKLSSLTTAQRNALSASNGMMIYNTTDGQMQGRIAGSWVDLVGSSNPTLADVASYGTNTADQTYALVAGTQLVIEDDAGADIITVDNDDRTTVISGLNVGMNPGAFNMGTYSAFLLGDLAGEPSAGFGNGGLFAVARADGGNQPYVGFTGYDDGFVRYLFFGGGGWGVTDATDISFWTADYDETPDQGKLRMEINSVGDVRIGDNLSFLNPAGAQLDIEQSDTVAAQPTIKLSQDDLSEEFIRFSTTVGAGNPIDTAALGAYYGKVRVYVEGVGAKWLALYD